ncbi:MAG: hypothetical protein ACM3YN_13285 [Parcubacteria group bacterium]
MLKLLIIAGAMTLGMATAASAETPCKGAAPAPGAVLHGPVLHVEDGGRLCVARGFDIESWVEVQLADAPPELARGPLMSAAFAKDVDCKVGADGRAVCTVEGQSVSELAQQPSVQKAGMSWR